MNGRKQEHDGWVWSVKALKMNGRKKRNMFENGANQSVTIEMKTDSGKKNTL